MFNLPWHCDTNSPWFFEPQRTMKEAANRLLKTKGLLLLSKE
jgi:hypothetical protein